MKRVTGQSVADFIFEMLYSEARTLLTHSKLSIQEIASSLNFSDQSSLVSSLNGNRESRLRIIEMDAFLTEKHCHVILKPYFWMIL